VLIERASQLEKDVAALASLSRLAEDTKLLETRQSMLGTPTDELAKLATTVTVFRQWKLPMAFDVWRAENLRTLAQTLQTEYVASPESILDEDAAGRFAFWDALKQLPNQLCTSLRETWRAHIDSAIVPEQTELLDVMANVPDFADQVAAIRKLYADVARLRSILPESDQQVVLVAELAAKIDAAWKGLEGDGIPDAVLTFLRAASTDGATLDQLTPDVADWLTGRGLRQRVSIRLGRAL
jgi:hypothetical protein